MRIIKKILDLFWFPGTPGIIGNFFFLIAADRLLTPFSNVLSKNLENYILFFFLFIAASQSHPHCYYGGNL